MSLGPDRVPTPVQTARRQGMRVPFDERFQGVDYHNERWLELALFGDRRYPAGDNPSFDELMAERDGLFKKHPKTTFIAAHMGWHANDLGRLGKMLDTMPNVYTEVGAVLYDIGRQPRAARDFFVKYQDRLLFGKDSFQPEEYPYYWRVFETKDDYFDYYRNYHAFWKLLRHRSARCRVEEALLPERAALDAGAAANRLAEIVRRGRGQPRGSGYRTT